RDALGCRLLRGLLRLQPDLAQGPAGFWAARELSGFAERCDKIVLHADPSHDFHQTPQPFARHQHQIVAGSFDKAPDPGFYRRGIGRVMDGEHRTLQHVRALFSEQAGELRFLARYQDEDAVAGEPVSPGLALTDIIYRLFILTLP